MKYEVDIKMVTCGKGLLEDTMEDMKSKKDADFTITYDDGSTMACDVDIQIKGRDIMIRTIYEGSGHTFDEKVKELRRQIYSGEFQRSLNDSKYPEYRCSRVIATFKSL